MGYINILNKELNEYLCTNYKENAEIQAILASYKGGKPPELELFEVIDREILYEFLEDQDRYFKLTREGLDEIVAASEDYISYFIGNSISEVYEYYDEVDIKTVLLQTDLYKYNDIYCLVWGGY